MTTRRRVHAEVGATLIACRAPSPSHGAEQPNGRREDGADPCIDPSDLDRLVEGAARDADFCNIKNECGVIIIYELGMRSANWTDTATD